jgi:hypothetical protein
MIGFSSLGSRRAHYDHQPYISESSGKRWVLVGGLVVVHDKEQLRFVVFDVACRVIFITSDLGPGTWLYRF